MQSRVLIEKEIRKRNEQNQNHDEMVQCKCNETIETTCSEIYMQAHATKNDTVLTLSLISTLFPAEFSQAQSVFTNSVKR